MQPYELSFEFGGYDCLKEFGLTWVPDSVNLSLSVERNEYEIAGAPGTVLYEGKKLKTGKIKGTLYALNADEATLANQSRICFMLQRVVSLLKSGRKPLTFPYLDGTYYLAQVDDELNWSYKSFIDGGLPITFTVQPYRYLNYLNEASGTTLTTSLSIDLRLDGDSPAPLCAKIVNKGLKKIADAQLTLSGKSYSFEGVDLETGDSLTISGEAPIDAIITRGNVNTSALNKITAFDEVSLQPGANSVSAVIAYGSDSANGAAYTNQTEAEISLWARGRFE